MSVINCRKLQFRELIHCPVCMIVSRLWTSKWSNKAAISIMYQRTTFFSRLGKDQFSIVSELFLHAGGNSQLGINTACLHI